MKNLITYFSVTIFLISMIFASGKLIAEQRETAKKVEVVESKVEKLEDEKTKEIEELKDEQNETQKIIVEQKVALEYIAKTLEKIDQKLEKQEEKREKKK